MQAQRDTALDFFPSTVGVRVHARAVPLPSTVLSTGEGKRSKAPSLLRSARASNHFVA